MPYRSLRPEELIETLRRLERRVDERFAARGIAAVCREIIQLAERARETADDAARPILSIRIAAVALVALILAGLAVTGYVLSTPEEPLTLVEFVQVLEAGINDVVLIGLAVFFMMSLERRIKRRRILAAIHELRSIAHVVDMHQLTKDPGRIVTRAGATASSPARDMTPEMLSRYLDYCSEMLSLIGKIAALYVQHFDDDLVLAAVNEVETLTSGLSSKVWQKLLILEQRYAPGA